MKARVLLYDCPDYDPARIADIISRGMAELGVRPRGRTMVKPNCVLAHPDFFPHAFTRPEFLDGLLAAVNARREAVSDLSVGERCGITIPTRYNFANAGYPRVLRHHGARAEYFDEGPQVPTTLTRPGSLRDTIYIPRAVAECDFLINAPKFKAHPWTKITLALKNYIGLQDDRHRLIDHDYMLHTKIADLQEVISPGLIAVDAIVAGERTMLTPDPFPLRLIIMGVNPVAVDAVGTRIVGLDPAEVDHVRICAERDLGPIAEHDIEIGGDVSLAEARERARGLRLSLDKVDRIFNGRSNLTVHLGAPPDPAVTDYCWGGCPGSLFEDMQILERMQPGVYHTIKPMHIVFGRYVGAIDAQPGEKVVFIGDCAQYSGQVFGKRVEIPNLYVPRERRDPRRARAGDVVSKMLGVFVYLARYAGQRVLRVRGCPSSMAETVLYLAYLGGTANPYLHPKIVFRFQYYYLISKVARWWRLGIAERFHPVRPPSPGLAPGTSGD